MMLARDRVTITLDGRRHTLRPTLQAAMRLERSIGIAAVLKGILEGNATIMATVVRETANLDHDLSVILDALALPTLAEGVRALRDPLATIVLAMYGIDPEAEQKPVAEGEGIPFAEHIAQLYRIATGWLGWTPSVAWDATPAEIMEAYTGRVDMLSAIFGGGKKAGPQPSLDDKFKAVFGGMAKRKPA